MAPFDELSEAEATPRQPVAAADLKRCSPAQLYAELVDRLIPYVVGTRFTHIELLPIAEHSL